MTNQPSSKDRLEKTIPKTLITDPDRDTSTYNPTGQATSACKQKTIQAKETQGLYKKAQSVVTKGLQTNNTVFIKKAN